MGLVLAALCSGYLASLHFGSLDYSHTMRIVIPAALFLRLHPSTKPDGHSSQIKAEL
jgi:hypothetical protein